MFYPLPNTRFLNFEHQNLQPIIQYVAKIPLLIFKTALKGRKTLEQNKQVWFRIFSNITLNFDKQKSYLTFQSVDHDAKERAIS